MNDHMFATVQILSAKLLRNKKGIRGIGTEATQLCSRPLVLVVFVVNVNCVSSGVFSA